MPARSSRLVCLRAYCSLFLLLREMNLRPLRATWSFQRRLQQLDVAKLGLPPNVFRRINLLYGLFFSSMGQFYDGPAEGGQRAGFGSRK